MRKQIVVAVCLAVLTAAPSLAKRTDRDRAAGTMAAARPRNMAVAVIHPTAGNNVTGMVTFTQAGNRVIVVADVQGLPPNSTHGFHVHENGDCSAPDATSAGGHFNPERHPHAGPDTPSRHAGDLGNLEADSRGRAYKRMTVDNLTVANGPDAVLGRAVIVHEKMDDFKTQPTGNAGARVACGVVTLPQTGTAEGRRGR